MVGLIDSYLNAAGRPPLLQQDPLIEWIFDKVLSVASPDLRPELRSVDSNDQRTSMIKIGDSECLVWDNRYATLLQHFQACLITLPTSECWRATEKAVTLSLEMLLRARGKSQQADLMRYEYVPQDWNQSMDPLARAALDYIASGLKNKGNNENPYRNLSSQEIDELIQEQLAFPIAEVSAYAQMIHSSIVFFIIAHELGHWIFKQHPDKLIEYRKVVAELVANPSIDEKSYRIALPAFTSFVKVHPDGEWLESTDPDLLMGAATWNAYAANVLKNDVLLEEVCCDLFAVNAFITTMIPIDGSQLQFAEFDQALWLSHQYIKWMSYLRYNTMSHVGLEDLAYEALEEKHARGLLKLAFLKHQMKGRVTPEQVQDIDQHRVAISWFDLLYELKQERVFDRLAKHPEILVGILNLAV